MKEIIITNIYPASTPQRLQAYTYCSHGLRDERYRDREALVNWARILKTYAKERGLENNWFALSDNLKSEEAINKAFHSLERNKVKTWLILLIYEITSRLTKVELSPTSIRLAAALYGLISIYLLAGYDVVIQIGDKVTKVKADL